jgi:serine/threonine-protein kinase
VSSGESRRGDPRDEPGSLLPDRWQELSPLIDAVLDAPRERRTSVLAEVSAGDRRLQAEIERLVAACEGSIPMLDRPAAEGFSRLLVEDVDAEIPEILGGRYRIEREVGRGGMARVYLAHDLKHARPVAVKVIRPEVAASLGRDRFLREMEIVARLRHPNIVPLYDSGDADGILYFVMPYEEGSSLRSRLDRNGVLPVSECVSILRDIARALAYAHEHRVVHRDVKPDNVMLSGGAAVVTDFGIAKAIAAAGDNRPERNRAPALSAVEGSDPLTGRITQIGAGIGTPAYMAPEQAVGDPTTDHRADIYSFGCLAYELFAGHPPFHDLPTHEIIAAHVGLLPVSLSEVSTAVPPSVARLIERCLEKQPAARPQTAEELLAGLEGTHTEPNEFARRPRVRSPVMVVASLIVGAVLIGAGYLVSHARASSAGKAPREATVAVLPLVSLGDSVQRDLAYGLSDEIATALVKVPGVRVMSRRSIAGSRQQRDIDTEKAGRELGAQFLVMGSLRAVNGRLTVLAKLLQASDGATLWADQFDRGLDDLAAVREEIAKCVGDSLRRLAGVPADSRAPERPARAINPEAYRLYVLGERGLTMRGQSMKASIERFKRATELDTLYADAFSGLSLALALAPYFEPISTREVSGPVRSAAERALRLDPTLAPPHVALGLVHQFAYQWDSAAVEFQTAVRLRKADDIEPLVQYGRYMLHTGRSADALKQFLAARRTEPASALVSSWVAFAYFLQGQMDSALVERERAFQNDSTNYTTLQHGALIRVKAGDFAGARDLINRLSRYDRVTLWVLAATGDTATALERLRELERKRPTPWLAATTRAYVMFGIGDTTEAMAALERATDANELWPAVGSVLDPIYDPIRSSTRFHALLRRVNLPLSEAIVGRRPHSR